MEELGASEAHKTEILDYEVIKIQKENSNSLGTLKHNIMRT